VLFNEGRKRPFRSPWARLVWAVVLGLITAVLSAFMGLGLVEAVHGGRVGDIVVSAFLTTFLAAGAVACGVGAVQAARALSRGPAGRRQAMAARRRAAASPGSAAE